MMAGSNIELLQRVSGATDAGILASGGVDSLDDLPPLAPYLPEASALGEIENEMTGRIR